MSTPYHILILTDGRPGHENLSEGIAAAIARTRSTETSRLVVKRGRWPGRLLAWLANSGLAPDRLLVQTYGLTVDQLPPCDLIISAGAETLAANVWSARLLGAPSIFYGSLRAFRATDFTLVLGSYKVATDAPNMHMFLKPSAINPETYTTTGKDIGLILGGDAGGVRFRMGDWRRLAGLVEETHQRHGNQWRISNSRRTPEAASELFRALAARADYPAVRAFTDVRTAEAAPLSTIFAACARIICTADSSSMVSEAVWARRRVISAAPEEFRLPSREQAYRSWLSGQAWCVAAPIASLSAAVLFEMFDATEPMSDNPQTVLAALVATELSLDSHSADQQRPLAPRR